MADAMIDVISHHFIGGVYCKEMRIPDGFEVISHKHEYDHMSVLTKGCVIVEADGQQETYYGPAIIEIKAGVKHSITAVNGDAHWLCIHATDCTDESKVDEVLIQKSETAKRHMSKLSIKFNVEQAMQELSENPQLWNEYTLRTQAYEDSPHREVSDIWLRYRDWSEFDPENPKAFSNTHVSVWYPSIHKLPAIRQIIDNITWAMPVHAQLGGVLITKIPPGGQVYPHSDAGSWHADYYNKKILVLLQSAPGQKFCFDGEEHEGEAGEVFEFDNAPAHWVTNNSNVDRISLILAIRDIP